MCFNKQTISSCWVDKKKKKEFVRLKIYTIIFFYFFIFFICWQMISGKLKLFHQRGPTELKLCLPLVLWTSSLLNIHSFTQWVVFGNGFFFHLYKDNNELLSLFSKLFSFFSSSRVKMISFIAQCTLLTWMKKGIFDIDSSFKFMITSIPNVW